MIAAVLVVLGAGTAFAYVKYDVFKSPKDIYLESETQNFQKLVADLEKNYDQNYEEYIKPYIENPYQTKVELSSKFTNFNTGDPQFTQYQQMIEKSKLQLDYAEDQKNKKAAFKATLNLNGSTLPAAELYQNNNSIYAAIPDIYKKYFFFNLDDQENLKKAFGNNVPKRITSTSDYMNAVKISKEELSPILKAYATLYFDKLDPKQFSMESKEFKDGSYSTKAREITITFSDEQFVALTQSIADKMASDDTLHNLLASRIENLAKLIEESGKDSIASQLRKTTKITIKADLEKFRDNLKDGLSTFKTTDGVKLILNVDSNDNILSREITTSFDEGKATYRSTDYQDSNKQSTLNYSLKMEPKNTSQGNLLIEFTYHNTPSDNTPYNGDFNFSYTAKGIGSSNTTFSIDSKFNTKDDGNKKDSKANCVVNTTQGNQSFKASLDVSNTITGTVKDKKRDFDQSFSLTFNNVPNSPLRGTVALNIKKSEEFGAPVNIPTFDSSNTLDASKPNSPEYQKGLQEFSQALGLYLSSNPTLMGMSRNPVY